MKDRETDAIVFDIEIARTVEEVGGWENTHLMGIGVAVLWESLTDRFLFYGPGEDEQRRLCERILAADVVSGFNIAEFDLPVAFEIPRSEWTSSATFARLVSQAAIFDLFRVARGGLGLALTGPCGKGLNLQECVCRTLGHLAGGGKTAHGSEAPEMFKAGRLNELAAYCLDDVTLEKNLFLHAVERGFIVTGQGVARVSRACASDMLLSFDANAAAPRTADRWLRSVSRPIAGL